jgi:DNA-binding FadR family transcriptional regulator
MSLGWPVGESLGSEADLIEHFGVSRAVLREAVRIVEHHGAARMRRGPGGGLIITVPDTQAVVQSAALLLDQSGVTERNLLDARSSLELACVRLATEQIDAKSIDRLREMLAREDELGLAGVATGHPHTLHIAIAEATGNPVLKLLVEILTRLTFDRTAHLPVKTQDFEDAHKAHVAIVEAIIAGDSALAQQRLSRHLAAISPYYRPRPTPGG